MGKKKDGSGQTYEVCSPLFVNKGRYWAEKSQGKGHDLYFQTQDEMLDVLQDTASIYTPMVWNEGKGHYIIDFDSAELLGY